MSTAPTEIPAQQNRSNTIILTVGFSLIAFGFVWFDPWFYKNIALRINTNNPASGDFYQTYKLIFQALRIAPYVVFGLILWLAAVNNTAGGWRGAVAALSGVLAGSLVANLLQMAIGRMRPNAAEAQSHLSFYPPLSGLWSDHADGFPSGEAGATLAIAATLCLLIPRLSGLWIVLGLLGPLVRLIPGMHYFSDVVAGGLIGWLLAGCVSGVVLRKLQTVEQSAKEFEE